MSSRSKASVRRSSSWALVSRDGVQGMDDSTFSCQTENTEVNIIQEMMFKLTLTHIHEALDEYLDFEAESPLTPFTVRVSYEPSESKKDFLNRVVREATSEYTNAMGSTISEQKIGYWIQKYFEGKTQHQITETMLGGGAKNEEHVKTALQAYSIAIGHSLKRGQKELKSVLIKIDEFYEWWTTNKPGRPPPDEYAGSYLLGAIRTDIAPWPKEKQEARYDSR
jgi:hypothetical protein